ncbi:MAG TPA: helix-turn-helix domain-containing protein [Gammaproteobacteria bacterium]
MNSKPQHVVIAGLPDAAHSTVAGLADVFNVIPDLRAFDDAMPATRPFRVSVAGAGDSRDAALPFRVERNIGEIDDADIVIVPSLMVSTTEWRPGGLPQVVEWLKAMHAKGATLCSACSGGLLLAETGLLRDSEATTHWAYAGLFRRHFPDVRLRLEHLLVQTGQHRELVMSGASGSWTDLALYLVSRTAGIAAAQAVAKFMLLEWHVDGQLPFFSFLPVRDHRDAVIRDAQEWLDSHLDVSNPVDTMTCKSGLPPRTFKRRFARATGYSPIQYVQQLRIEAAKRRLERTAAAVDEVASQVGYEDAAFFRRLFKRVTGISPSAYRRKLQLPGYARQPFGATKSAGKT